MCLLANIALRVLYLPIKKYQPSLFPALINTLRSKQNVRHFTRRHFRIHFLDWMQDVIKNVLHKFVPKGATDNIPALFQSMALCWPSDKPLSEPMMVSLLTHICATLSQWVNLVNTSGFSNQYQWYPSIVDDTRGSSFLCISWWRHQMETFSALLALCAGNSPVPGEFPHKGQWRGALMYSLICTWINDWVNTREAGDLRRYRGHYDVIVILT